MPELPVPARVSVVFQDMLTGHHASPGHGGHFLWRVLGHLIGYAQPAPKPATSTIS